MAALIELSNSTRPEWTLIGGQMVSLHAAEHAAPPLGASRDIDVVVNARVVAGAVRQFVADLESSGFELADTSPDGVAHRYVREGTSIDVLAPEGLGRRANLTTTPPGRTIQAPGGTQALNRTELVPVEYGGSLGLVPRPSLLGAIIVKAAAIAVDDAPHAQELDLALLLSLVADPSEMAAAMTKKDRARLRGGKIGDDSHAVWSVLQPEAADRARLAYRSLSDPLAGGRNLAKTASTPLELSASSLTNLSTASGQEASGGSGNCGYPTPTGPCKHPRPLGPNGRCAAGHRR